jgi:hypothetical protein
MAHYTALPLDNRPCPHQLPTAATPHRYTKARLVLLLLELPTTTMGGCLSVDEVTKSAHPETENAALDAKAADPTSSRSSELTSHMIRERKHHNVWDCE